MKFPDMNQYIILLFSLLVEFFFATQNPTSRRGRQAPAFARVPQNLEPEMSRIYRISKISKR